MQNHELKNEMQTAKRRLRSAQRRAHASQRIALTEKIMKSSQSDNKLFHKLIQNQRRSDTSNPDIMVFNKNAIDNPEKFQMDGGTISQNYLIMTSRMRLVQKNLTS
ncbi:Hypothetical predicted protein [Mytilus galloprovincialis]|uniref:Uncharacterized protein n=1 Tax=Mytilus galloprovincialis TaxID=29158 RepID=A0A8B6CQS8_MYTGA|nr:Hypothetical predicted protein [Mytilus galloprovincialis]